MYCLHNVSKQESNQLDLLSVLGKLAKRLRIHAGVQPPPVAADLSSWLAARTIGRTLMPDRTEAPGRLEFLALHRKVWNGRIWLQEPEHYCWDPTKPTGRCHNTDLEVIEDAIASFTYALGLIFNPTRSPAVGLSLWHP